MPLQTPHDDAAGRFEPVEIAAGELQLLPASADLLLRAEAGGLTVADADAAWTAHDAVSAEPRAVVVLKVAGGSARVAAVALAPGSGADAAQAREVVRRYAREALGLVDG